jgi:hypothetical protein
LSAEGTKNFKGCIQQYFLRQLNIEKCNLLECVKEYSSTQKI